MYWFSAPTPDERSVPNEGSDENAMTYWFPSMRCQETLTESLLTAKNRTFAGVSLVAVDSIVLTVVMSAEDLQSDVFRELSVDLMANQ